VPVGKKIRFDETVDELHPYNIRMYEKRRWNRNDWDVDWDWDNYFEYETNVDYIMKSDGELKNMNRVEEKKDSGDYRYEDKEQLRQEIKDREQKLEEERKKLQEDKKRLNDTTKPKTTAQESIDENDDEANADQSVSSIGSPVFALANMFN